MQQVKLTAWAMALVFLSASCGGGKKERDAVLTDKKVQLEKLKTEKTQTETKIKTLEESLSALD